MSHRLVYILTKWILYTYYRNKLKPWLPASSKSAPVRPLAMNGPLGCTGAVALKRQWITTLRGVFGVDLLQMQRALIIHTTVYCAVAQGRRGLISDRAVTISMFAASALLP